MKKILMMLLVCTLALTVTLSFSACGLFDKPEDPTPDNSETPGDQPGINSEDDANIFEDPTSGGNGIDLPIIDVNSSDMTQPEEETEGETEDGGETDPEA